MSCRNLRLCLPIGCLKCDRLKVQSIISSGLLKSKPFVKPDHATGQIITSSVHALLRVLCV